MIQRKPGSWAGNPRGSGADPPGRIGAIGPAAR